jgi:hypothetical protein
MSLPSNDCFTSRQTTISGLRLLDPLQLRALWKHGSISRKRQRKSERHFFQPRHLIQRSAVHNCARRCAFTLAGTSFNASRHTSVDLLQPMSRRCKNVASPVNSIASG